MKIKVTLIAAFVNLLRKEARFNPSKYIIFSSYRTTRS